MYRTWRSVRLSLSTLVRSASSRPRLSKSLQRFHRQEEASFAHSVMEKLPRYQNSLGLSVNVQLQNLKQHASLSVTLAGSDKVLPLTGVFAVFVKESLKNKDKRQRLDDERFTQFCLDLSQTTHTLSDEQLLVALHLLSTWEILSPTDRNFSRIWNALDIELMRRLKKWDVERSLLVADMWFAMKLNRITGYNKAMINHLTSQLECLTSHQLVQLLFFVTLQRTCEAKVMFSFEDKVEKYLSTLTAEELAVVCLSFFKTQNMMQSENLLQAILDRLVSELQTLPDFAVVAFAKLLRYSATKFLERNSNFWQVYDSLLNACIPQLNSWSSTTCVHFALITTNVLLDHATFFNAMATSLQPRLSDLRLKDLTKFLHCLAKFDRAPKPNSKFYKIVIEELKSNIRKEEVALYPDYLVACLANLTYCQVLPKTLFNQVLSPDFLKSVAEKINQDNRELFHLDCTLDIELPTYRGNRLSPSLRHMFWQKYKSRIPDSSTPSLTYLEGLLLEVQGLLSSILGSNKAAIFPTLPHFNWPDIVVHTSRQQFLQVNSLQPTMNLCLPSNDGMWHCFVIGHRSCYSANSKRLLGYAKTKIRQLQKMGYNVVEVPWFEYNVLSTNEKRRYLHNLLNEIKKIGSY